MARAVRREAPAQLDRARIQEFTGHQSFERKFQGFVPVAAPPTQVQRSMASPTLRASVKEFEEQPRPDPRPAVVRRNVHEAMLNPKPPAALGFVTAGEQLVWLGLQCSDAYFNSLLTGH